MVTGPAVEADVASTLDAGRPVYIYSKRDVEKRRGMENMQTQLIPEATAGVEAESVTRPQKLWPADEQPVLACSDNLTFMRELPDEKMKLIVNSPPYNLGKEYEAKASLEVYLSAQERVISECIRVLDPQGSICWQVGNYVDNGEIVPLDTVLYPLFRDHGLKLRNRIVLAF